MNNNNKGISDALTNEQSDYETIAMDVICKKVNDPIESMEYSIETARQVLTSKDAIEALAEIDMKKREVIDIETINVPLWEIDEDFLNPNEELTEVPVWVKMGKRRALPKQGLISIDAKPKQGKSFSTYAMLLPIATGKAFGTINPLDKPNLIIIFDTEMSKYSLLPRYRALRNSTSTSIDNILIVPLLGTPRDKMWEKVEEKVATYNPDIIVIDHISKFVADINSHPEAGEVSQRLSALKANRSVFVVIHQNKGKEDSNMRGALGSIINDDQCESYTAVRKDGRFNLIPKSARDSNVEDADVFSFAVEEDDEGVICKFIDASNIEKQKEEEYRKKWLDIMKICFAGDETLQRSILLERIHQKYRSDVDAKNVFNSARDCRVIVKCGYGKFDPWRINEGD